MHPSRVGLFNKLLSICRSSNKRRLVCSTSRSATLLSPFSLIFYDSLILNHQQLKAFEDHIKPSEKPVVYVERSLEVDQEFGIKILNKFDNFL